MLVAKNMTKTKRKKKKEERGKCEKGRKKKQRKKWKGKYISDGEVHQKGPAEVFVGEKHFQKDENGFGGPKCRSYGLY